MSQSQAWKDLERRVCRDMGLTRRGQVTRRRLRQGSDNDDTGPLRRVQVHDPLPAPPSLGRTGPGNANDGRPWVLVIAEHSDRHPARRPWTTRRS